MNKPRKSKLLVHGAVITSVMFLAGFSATDTPQPNRLKNFSLAPAQLAAKLEATSQQRTARETSWQHKAIRVTPRAHAETMRQADNLGGKLRALFSRAQTETAAAVIPHVSAEQHAQVRALNNAHQANGGIEARFDQHNGTLSHLALPKNAAAKIEAFAAKETAHVVAKKFLADNRTLLKMEDPSAEVKLMRENTEANGHTHLRFQQTYKGVPLFGKELMVHMDSQREVTLLQGRHEPTPKSIEVNPAITPDAAHGAAIKDLALGPYKFPAPVSELVIHTAEKSAMTLAYKVVTKPALNQHWIHFVDAQTGKVIDRIDNIQSAVVTGTGTDLNGQARNFTAWSAANGRFYLIDPTTPSTDVAGYDPVAALIAGNPRSDTIIETAKNTEGSSLDFVTSLSLSTWDAAAVSAAFNTRYVYDYYKNIHRRNSLDDKNATLQAVIHFGSNLDNAFWNGTHMVYGDGGTVFNPLARCLDVAAHEMTHGVIENSAGLIYVNQSGALNESFADVFAAMVDNTNWTVGDGCVKGAPYLRNLANPALGRSPQPSKMSEYQQLPQTKDNGGVHVNSGIPNRAAYLIAEGLSAEGLGTSIGRAHTEQIYYRALTTYLLQSSQFVDARRATIKAAQDLYPADVAAVTKAWDVVQVTDSGNAPSVPKPTDAVAGSDLMIYLTNPTSSGTPPTTSFDIFVQKMAASFTGYDAANDKGSYTGATPNALHKRPSAITFKDTNGRVLTDILYVDSANNIRLVEIDPATLGLVSNQNITTTGGFNSIAISADNRYVAVTTTSLTDNQIHFIDLKNATGAGDFNIILAPENYQSTGAAQNSVLFADTLHFDYSGQYLVFDALNCIPLPSSACTPSSGGYRYWSIGRVDLPNRQLQYLLPGQDPALDIGNPVFATNNRNIIALDVIDYTDPNNPQFLVASYDLEQQQPYLIADLGADGINSGSQPSFWGNDDFITFIKPDATIGRKAFRVPVDSKGAATGAPVELNPYGVTAPLMHRTGVRALTGNITPNVNLLDFGAVVQLDSRVLQLTLSNSGNSDVSITSLNIDNAQAFKTNLTNGLIPRGTSAVFDVLFQPTLLGTQTGTLSITTDGKPTTVQVALSGFAAAPPAPTPVPTGNGGGGGGGGCALGGDAPLDPVWLLFVAGALIHLRRRKLH
jgi:Zn-dependent metalloprotease